MDEFVAGLLCAGVVFFLPAFAGVLLAWLQAQAARNEVRAMQGEVEKLNVAFRLLRVRVESGQRVVPTAPAAGEPLAPAAPAPSAPLAPVAPAPSEPLAPAAPAPGATPPIASAPSAPARAAASTPPVPPRASTPPRPPAPEFNLGAFIERNAVWAFAAVGGLLLVVAALFGLREAILAGWFGPVARFAIGIMVGVGAWFVAELLRWRKYDIPSAALTGAGAAILYATLYAGHSRWGLLPQTVTFAAMVALSAVSTFTAWRRDSRFIAYLALAGGYATPILLSTGENKAVAFFGYLAVVNVGILAAAWRRGWPDVVAVSGMVTTLLYTGWLAQFRAPDQVPVGLFAAAIFGFGYLAMVPRAPTAISAVAAVVGLAPWTVGALGLATPTDTLSVDPRTAMPLPWDLGSSAWMGAAYLAIGAVVLPRLLARWKVARVGAGLLLGFVLSVFALSWALAGEGRWEVVALAVPITTLLAMASGRGGGISAFLLGGIAIAAADGISPMSGDRLVLSSGLMLLAALVGAYFRNARPLLPVAAAVLSLPLYSNLQSRLESGETAAVLLCLLPLYFTLAVPPFVRPRRGDLWGVLGASLVPIVIFWPLYQIWASAWGTGATGVLPILLGANTLLGAIVLVRSARAALEDRELALLVAVTLLSVAVAIPVQLDRTWLTVGWSLEIALLALVSRRLRHPLIIGGGAVLAAIVAVRLLLNPYALDYGAGGGWIIFNWTLYTWGIPTVCFLLAARWYEVGWLRTGLRFTSVLTGFALLNLEIAHAFAKDNQLSFRSERLGEEMTRSIAWGGYGLMLIVLGIFNKSRATRILGLLFAVLGAGKVFLVDSWSLSGFARVGAYGGMAVTLLAAAVAFAYLVRNDSSSSPSETK